MIRNVRAYFLRVKQRNRIADERQKADLRLEAMIPFVIEKKSIFIHANEARLSLRSIGLKKMISKLSLLEVLIAGD